MRASIHSPAIFRLVALFYLGFPSTIRYGEGTFLAESMKAGPKAAATCVLFGCSRIPLEHPVLLVVGEITAAAEMRIRRRGNYVTGRNQSRRYRRPAFVLSPILLARGFLSGISFFSPSCPTGIRATSSTGGYPRSSQVLLTVEAGRSALEEASLDPADRSENGVIDETDPYKIELGNKGPVICRVINGLYQVIGQAENGSRSGIFVAQCIIIYVTVCFHLFFLSHSRAMDRNGLGRQSHLL